MSIKMNFSSNYRLLFVLLVGLHCFNSQTVEAKGWKVVKKEDQIVVSQRSEPGRDLPSFKGTGLVNAGMYEILAILRDGPRRKEWMSKSGKTMVLEEKNVFEAISYQQTIAPFPVSDREVIMRTQVYLRENPKEIIATFDGLEWQKPIPGVDRDDFVWMPYLKGYWRLVEKAEGQTEVTYMVNTDPGGLLPNMLIRRITHYLPLWTLQGLRKQVKRRAKSYEQFLNDYDPKRNPNPKAVPLPLPASMLKMLD